MILRIAGAAIFIGAAAAAERLLERGHRKKRASLAHVPPEVLQALNGNERLFDNQELELLIMLVEEGNRHLFEDWPPPGRDDDQKKHFARKVVQLDAGYAEGGLRGYIMNARRLLKDSLQGKNAFEGYTPGVPTGISLDYGSEEFQQLEALGVAEAAAAGFVLVAGGLGERLGYSGIKLALPLFIESILALQQRGSAAAGGGAPRKLPLAIMTSDDTHCRTAALLEKHSFFGMQPDQVVLMKQEKVACLQDNDARLALANGKKYDLMTKPHGHGDVHALLWSRGIAERWQQQGVRWVCFFQDTNGLVFRALPAALGVSAREGYDMNSLAVPRRAKEAIGAITQLVSKDGSRSMTVNVEYNQLDPLLRACGWKKGDMNEARTGYSPFPGNINQLVLKLEPYLQQLKLTRGIIGEFVNPKYKDAAKSTFKSPTRLECMMQDYPKDLPPTARVGFTVVKQVWAGYSPVKNSPADALAKANSGNPTHSATTGEVDIYNAQAKSLKMVGVNVGSATSATFNGLSVDMLPRVVLSPSFACSLRELRTKIGRGGASRTGWSAAFSSGRNDVKLSTDSVLVVEGPNISIRKLSVSGALVVRAVPGAHVEIDGLAVVNRGWSWKPLQEGEDAPEEQKIRGFRVERSETCLLEFLTPGSYRPRGVIQGDVHEVMEKGRYSNTDLISP